jgi:HD-GYP domain-containing protein (c-di-GMP phosphodiesterase class II)
LMESVSIEELKAGSLVARHLYFHGNFIVFPKYLVLTSDDLERAKRFNIDTLAFNEHEHPATAHTENGDVERLQTDSGLDELLNARDSAKEGQASPSAVKPPSATEKPPVSPASSARAHAAEKPRVQDREFTIYGSIVALLSKEFMKVRLNEKIETSKVYKIASIIIEYVTNVREDAVLHVARGSEKSRVEAHSTNVGILAAILGLSLKMKGFDFINVVTGAILHDVGILLIQDGLSPEGGDADLIKDHTWQGFRYLKSIRNLDPTSVMPALQHHEKAGGDGYPQRITLNDTEPASRLVSLCDSFDNQINFLKYGNDLSIHFTKDEFVGWKKEDFDHDLFKASIRAMGDIFKNHTPVILNDGSLALIKEVSIRFPFSPVVQVVADDKGNKTADIKIVDTRKSREIWISRFLKRSP